MKKIYKQLRSLHSRYFPSPPHPPPHTHIQQVMSGVVTLSWCKDVLCIKIETFIVVIETRSASRAGLSHLPERAMSCSLALHYTVGIEFLTPTHPPPPPPPHLLLPLPTPSFPNSITLHTNPLPFPLSHIRQSLNAYTTVANIYPPWLKSWYLCLL